MRPSITGEMARALQEMRVNGHSFNGHYSDRAERAKPHLPRPACRVRLVCGPPAAGKSTYVRNHAAPDDIVIDVDDIAKQQGHGRQRDADDVGAILDERNRRLAALAEAPPERTAWVIVTAPSEALRQWWRDTLGVKPEDLILLMPTKDELFRRIVFDPDRREVRELHFRLVQQWFQREYGYGLDGNPRDPEHPWNAEDDDDDYS